VDAPRENDLDKGALWSRIPEPELSWRCGFLKVEKIRYAKKE